MGGGAVAGAVTYRQGIRFFPAYYNERVLTLASSWLMFVAW